MKRKSQERPAVVGYIRVSTDEQAREGVSLEGQRAQIEAYCQMRGLHLVDVVVDAGVSGGKPLEERDGGSQLLRLARSRKVSGVVAVKLDRLFRSARDCLATVEAWEKARVALHLLDLGGQSIDTGSAMGKMFLTMAAGFAELERNLVAERTQAALAHKKRKGERVSGKAPFGFQFSADGSHLVEVPAEQEVISIVKGLREEGLSLRRIAEELNSRGIANRAGGRFLKTQVSRILKQEAAAA